jgi:hypothetical protein
MEVSVATTRHNKKWIRRNIRRRRCGLSFSEPVLYCVGPTLVPFQRLLLWNGEEQQDLGGIIPLEFLFGIGSLSDKPWDVLSSDSCCQTTASGGFSDRPVCSWLFKPCFARLFAPTHCKQTVHGGDLALYWQNRRSSLVLAESETAAHIQMEWFRDDCRKIHYILVKQRFQINIFNMMLTFLYLLMMMMMTIVGDKETAEAGM